MSHRQCVDTQLEMTAAKYCFQIRPLYKPSATSFVPPVTYRAERRRIQHLPMKRYIHNVCVCVCVCRLMLFTICSLRHNIPAAKFKSKPATHTHTHTHTDFTLLYPCGVHPVASNNTKNYTYVIRKRNLTTSLLFQNLTTCFGIFLKISYSTAIHPSSLQV
jgi:hypothetical protein